MLLLSARKPQVQSGLSLRTPQIVFLLLLWAAIYGASLASPPLLDDADATHAQAAQAMLRTGDWVTLHVDGVRYLEKAPLPYWMTALSLRCFGANSFAAHLPLALTVLALAALAWVWAVYLFGKASDRTGFYAALFTLTSAGVFLFTRIFIPDALLSLLLGFTLYAGLRALETPSQRGWAYAGWAALGLAVLTKGLVALVFLIGAIGIYLALCGQRAIWRRLYPLSGACLLLAIAAPWHILAGLRNRGGANGHGFFWFYFINEHVLRFLGRRSPPDYNKLPAALYWSLHVVWLFPWSFFAPVGAMLAWQKRDAWWPLERLRSSREHRAVLLLLIFSALVLVFFSISTNQEYYTFPVYVPLLVLIAGAMVRAEASSAESGLACNRRVFLFCHCALTAVGLLAAAALAFGLWSSRHLPAASSVGDLLAHRGVAHYTLSMAHFFDLTTASFSALRLPAALACVVLAAGPLLAGWLRMRGQDFAATISIAVMSGLFLIAAHLALVRFGPMLSSQDFAATITELEASGAVSPSSQVLLYGDQAFGSSIPFYLGHPVELVDGRSTSMWFGSTFADAPRIFVTHQQLLAEWGRGSRKLLFVPLERRAEVERLLGPKLILIYESSGKALYTDRPLAAMPSVRDGQEPPRPEQ